MIEPMKDILRTVGSGLLHWQGRAGGEWQGAQLKTEADREAHRALSSALTGLLNVPVLSEEDPASHTDPRADCYWLIDPIDGTASLAGGFSGFVTQAALMQNGEPVLAAVYAPALEQMYTAEKGKGAFCNGERIRVSQNERRLILTDNYPEPRGTAAKMMKALPCTGYLESGSISLKILRVADGSADLFFKDVVVRDWDVGAPVLVLQEAGGFFTAVDGNPYLFSGNLEKPGLVAARDRGVCQKTASILHHS